MSELKCEWCKIPIIDFPNGKDYAGSGIAICGNCMDVWGKTVVEWKERQYER